MQRIYKLITVPNLSRNLQLELTTLLGTLNSAITLQVKKVAARLKSFLMMHQATARAAASLATAMAIFRASPVRSYAIEPLPTSIRTTSAFDSSPIGTAWQHRGRMISKMSEDAQRRQAAKPLLFLQSHGQPLSALHGYKLLAKGYKCPFKRCRVVEKV